MSSKGILKIPFLLFLALMPYTQAQAQERPVVAVSVLPQAFFVDQIAGNRVQVEVMIPSGASPASYEPTMRQLKAVSKAVLYIKVGHPKFPFEQTWLKRLIDENKTLQLIDSSQGLPHLPADPHVWVTPDCGRSMTQNVTRALTQLMPEHQAQFEQNQDSLLESIEALDQEIQQLLKPYAGQKFLVFHPAWGYFAEKYGLEQLAIEAHGKEPTPAELIRLINQARQENIRAIFVQPQFSQSEAETLAQDIKAELIWADPLAEDWLNNLRGVAYALQKVLAGSLQ